MEGIRNTREMRQKAVAAWGLASYQTVQVNENKAYIYTPDGEELVGTVRRFVDTAPNRTRGTYWCVEGAPYEAPTEVEAIALWALAQGIIAIPGDPGHAEDGGEVKAFCAAAAAAGALIGTGRLDEMQLKALLATSRDVAMAARSALARKGKPETK